MKYNNRYRSCLLLLLCVCVLLSMTACSKSPRMWTPVYNAHQCRVFVSRAFPIAYEEDLTPEDIASLLPAKQLPFDVFRGSADFMEDRSVYHIALYIGSKEAYTVLSLGPAATMLNACCDFRDTGEKSRCGNVEYTLFKSDDRLMAEAVINDTLMFARTYGEVDKQDFEAILECLSWYSGGKPNLAKITPKEHRTEN